MATARLNGVDPERYLSWALNQLKDGPAYPTQSDLIDLSLLWKIPKKSGQIIIKHGYPEQK